MNYLWSSISGNNNIIYCAYLHEFPFEYGRCQERIVFFILLQVLRISSRENVNYDSYLPLSQEPGWQILLQIYGCHGHLLLTTPTQQSPDYIWVLLDSAWELTQLGNSSLPSNFSWISELKIKVWISLHRKKIFTQLCLGYLQFLSFPFREEF